MKFDFTNTFDVNKARTYLDKLIIDKSKCDIIKPRTVRSLSQNSYVHVVITLFAIEFGYSLNEAKTLLKRECTFMYYEKNNMMFLKSTAQLNSKEMTDFIDFIRNYAGQQGLYIPTSSEYLENKFSIDRDIERNKTFL